MDVAPPAASGSASSPAIVSVLVRQRVTDPTSGFQALNRRGDRALRRRLPARLPGGGGDRDGAPPPAAAARGARDDARARGRASSITASHSVYYMVKVLLALFVGLFRRSVTPLEEDE